MRLSIFFICFLCLNACPSFVPIPHKKLTVLIVDGQNNHAIWPKSSYLIKTFLEGTSRFEVDIYRTKFTWNGNILLKQFPASDGRTHIDVKHPRTDPSFKPIFENYDVVISNFGWQAAPWPDETKQAFENYMKNGGGFVSVHAANNAFPSWAEYNRMIGVGGWGGRNEKDGPYIYVEANGEVTRDYSVGPAGGHGKLHKFEITNRDTSHPITSGLPISWFHSKDELYNRLRGPAQNMVVLASAFDSPHINGRGRHEPVAMAVEYYKGRVFHTTLGHSEVVYNDINFINLMIRGAQWAATGKVDNL